MDVTENKQLPTTDKIIGGLTWQHNEHHCRSSLACFRGLVC